MSLLLCVQIAVAQSTITGNVTDEQGLPLPGATVLEAGTSNGTTTDFDGNYSITVNDGAEIQFSYVGYSTVNQTVNGQDTINVSMEPSNQLEEVVITSYGIKKEAKSLGYSVASVAGDELSKRAEPDALRAMQGKMTGVVITGAGGAPGQSTKINIRGVSSLTGNTQPLFIVDGIPFDNSVNASQGAAQNTVFSNRAFDLDPNSIESISVLKGAAASALYGSRATNGVVVITTKAGSQSAKKRFISFLQLYFCNNRNFWYP